MPPHEMAHLPSTSPPPSILFTIPTEILDLIIGHVASDKSHLATLALVNSTCRQLARSCQFRSLHFDFGPVALEIIDLLQQEVDGVIVGPSLGEYVRQLTVDTSAYWSRLESLLPPNLDEGSPLYMEETRRIAAILSEQIENHYWPAALPVIPALTNLRYSWLQGRVPRESTARAAALLAASKRPGSCHV